MRPLALKLPVSIGPISCTYSGGAKQICRSTTCFCVSGSIWGTVPISFAACRCHRGGDATCDLLAGTIAVRPPGGPNFGCAVHLQCLRCSLFSGSPQLLAIGSACNPVFRLARLVAWRTVAAQSPRIHRRGRIGRLRPFIRAVADRGTLARVTTDVPTSDRNRQPRPANAEGVVDHRRSCLAPASLCRQDRSRPDPLDHPPQPSKSWRILPASLWQQRVALAGALCRGLHHRCRVRRQTPGEARSRSGCLALAVSPDMATVPGRFHCPAFFCQTRLSRPLHDLLPASLG